MATSQARLPLLRRIPISTFSDIDTTPTQKIRTDEDVEAWRLTRGYQDFGLFLRRLNESVVGYVLPWSSPSSTPAVESLLAMLDTLDKWIDDIPPLATPQRFGNLAFRTWGKRLQNECETLLAALLPSNLHAVIPQVAPYLLVSFGSFTRMDYGTGHETSFALFLLCLTLIRFFEPDPEQERALVLSVFLRYLHLCWKLQDVYRLEPAGSHGVWGLDDYSFLGYIFGSAQLRDSDTPVDAILHPPLPPTNLYFLSISRIHQVKHGPFHEHSSQLYNIAMGVKYWAKVNSGLLKMYEAEVLGKRVVVQHIPLGGLLAWDIPDISTSSGDTCRNSSRTPPTSISSTPSTMTTALPPMTWAAPPSRLPPVNSPPISHDTTARLPINRTSHASHEYDSLDNVRGASQLDRRFKGPLVPSKVPLGPLASTTHRQTSSPYALPFASPGDISLPSTSRLSGRNPGEDKQA